MKCSTLLKGSGFIVIVLFYFIKKKMNHSDSTRTDTSSEGSYYSIRATEHFSPMRPSTTHPESPLVGKFQQFFSLKEDLVLQEHSINIQGLSVNNTLK